MLEKIKVLLEEIKYQLTDKESVFYTSIKILIVIMLWVYPLPFMLLEKTSFKYTGYLYIITICLLIYFGTINQREDIKNDFLDFFKLFEKVFPYIVACFILFCLGPSYWTHIFLHGKPLKREYRQSYVYAFPNKDNAKSYRVKADLDYDSDSGMQVSKIYFNNGGYIEFDFCEDGFKFGDLFVCEPVNNEKDWYFRYYGEKVEK